MTRRDGQEPDPGTWLLHKIGTREQAVTCQIEQTQAEIDTLTTRLRELEEAAEHLRITRKTLLSLTDESEAGNTPPAPALPDHPAHRQIPDIFGDLTRPPAGPRSMPGAGPAHRP
ncbi:hypothetical protein [Nonomuraea typhae]|uniref:Uncharacterized protein n=1 Tax=Nonomuraea typhae TaxID=2603600 RepID=A0ABW7ZBE1_9ACTN